MRLTLSQRFEGSEHIPRLIDRLQPTHPDPSVPAGMSTFVIGARRLMVMEYLEHGDLRGYLEKLTEDYLRTGDYRPAPDRLLWSFFLCLARSCMALAWPRQSYLEVVNEYRAMDKWYMDSVPQPDYRPPPIPETRREHTEGPAPRRIVHFDIDPLNGISLRPPAIRGKTADGYILAWKVLVGNPTFSPEGDKEHGSVPILKVRERE